MNNTDTPLLRISDLSVVFSGGGLFHLHRNVVTAIDGVDLEIGYGQAVGVVGESGSGKTTLGRCVLGLQKPTRGNVFIEGSPIEELRKDSRSLYRRVQVVFQDPMASLNPTMTVAEILAEPLRRLMDIRTKIEIDRVSRQLLDEVRLPAVVLKRRPAGLSGGQRQRVSLARALAPHPKLIVLDEAVSALDMATQAQVINLLADLRDETGVSYLFISHDLAVVRHLCDDVAVMRQGKIVETGPTRQVCGNPQHDYTRALVDAVPVPDPTVKRIRQT